MAGEYDVNYLESWQGYEQPTDKTVQELEVEMQKALANAAQLTAEQQDGVIYMDADGRLILPLHSIVGYLHIRDATINSANIAVAAIGTAHIQDANITRAKIQHAAIGTAEIADASIITAKIENATITTAKIANAAITTALIDTGAITTAQIANGSITDAKIVSLVAGKITSGTIDTGQVDLSGPAGKLRITGNRVQVFDTSTVPVERVSMGDVFGNGSVYGFLMRAADGYTTMIDTTGVKSAGITDGAITNPKIGNGAVMNNNIYANTITGDKLVINAITAREIASKTITANEIAAQTITSASGLIGQISASDITTGTLTGATIRGANIYGTYIEGGTITGTSITGASLVGGVITSSNSQSQFSLTAGESRFYNNNNGSYVNMGPAGISGYNVATQKSFQLDSTYVVAEVLLTSLSNVYAATKGGGELRVVDSSGVPGSGNRDDYTYRPIRCANIVSNGYNVITTGNISNYMPSTPDLSAYALRSQLDNYYSKGQAIYSTGNYMTVVAGSSSMDVGNDGLNFFRAPAAGTRGYSGSANGYVSDGGTFGKTTSARRFKMNIKDLDDSLVSKFLNLRPRTWHDIGVVEDAARYADQITPFDQDGNEALYIAPPQLPNDVRPIEKIGGFIAEEVAEAGLSDFVVYGAVQEDGYRETQSIMYDRLWIPLVPIAKNHDDRLKRIEEILGITA